MQSLILVGGKGSRMGSITKSKPKSLVPINGTPPNLISPPTGCRFKSRCPFEVSKCETKPDRLKINDREVICWRTNDQTDLLAKSKKIETWESQE